MREQLSGLKKKHIYQLQFVGFVTIPIQMNISGKNTPKTVKEIWVLPGHLVIVMNYVITSRDDGIVIIFYKGNYILKIPVEVFVNEMKLMFRDFTKYSGGGVWK